MSSVESVEYESIITISSAMPFNDPRHFSIYDSSLYEIITADIFGILYFVYSFLLIF
jgi:hypothetical protein